MSTLSTTFLKTARAPRNPDQVYSCPPQECIQEFYDDYDGDVPSVISFLSLYISHLSYFPKFHSIANAMRQYEVNSKAMACSHCFDIALHRTRQRFQCGTFCCKLYDLVD